ncbi:hypothetical protein WN943_006985 [Citrus x changshan-huyou]
MVIRLFSIIGFSWTGFQCSSLLIQSSHLCFGLFGPAAFVKYVIGVEMTLRVMGDQIDLSPFFRAICDTMTVIMLVTAGNFLMEITSEFVASIFVMTKQRFPPILVVSYGSLLQWFVDSDGEFRNSRLKLIPSVPKGSWIVRQSDGSTPCLLGKAVDCNYIRGPKYLEVNAL